jgi:Dolichyl-phosphate-mannose-protein mannosyltransferase
VNRRSAHSRDAAWAALVAAVILGTLLRCAQYVADRSLWHDEALLALNIVGRTLRESVGRLHFAQAAPSPFMAAEWAVSRVGGYSEQSLRLVALVAGVGALVLFAVVARRYLAPWAAALATVVFAVADALLYYASELKPYSSDVLVTTVLVLLVVGVVEGMPTTRRVVATGIVGAAAMLWSYPSVFVAASAIVVLLVPTREGAWRQDTIRRLPLIVMWALAGVVVVVDARARTATVRDAFEYDSKVFGSSPAHGETIWSADLDLLNRFGSGLVNSLGISQERPLSHIAKIAALVILVGFVSLARRRPGAAAVVTLPFVATLLASKIHLYPITERTTLFLLPCVVLLTAEGTAWFAQRIAGRAGLALSCAIAIAILAAPVYSAGDHLVNPRMKEEMRPVLDALLRESRPGDTLYLQGRAQYAFRYYADCECLDRRLPGVRERFPFDEVSGSSQESPAVVPTTPRLIIGRPATEAWLVRRELRGVHGRLWFLYSHVNYDTEETFLQTTVPRVLDRLGTRIAVVRRHGAAAYLYELP